MRVIRVRPPLERNGEFVSATMSALWIAFECLTEYSIQSRISHSFYLVVRRQLGHSNKLDSLVVTSAREQATARDHLPEHHPEFEFISSFVYRVPARSFWGEVAEVNRGGGAAGSSITLTSPSDEIQTVSGVTGRYVPAGLSCGASQRQAPITTWTAKRGSTR